MCEGESVVCAEERVWCVQRRECGVCRGESVVCAEERVWCVQRREGITTHRLQTASDKNDYQVLDIVLPTIMRTHSC